MLEPKIEKESRIKCAKKHKGIRRFFIILGVLMVLVGGSFLLYTAKYYHATREAKAAIIEFQEGEVKQSKDAIVFKPEHAVTGFVFYPGGKVEYTAYAPLMKALAENNILCILIKMPFNLAVFDSDAANQYVEQYKEIETWYIGGHSLGGAMAANYISKNKEKFAGLVLLAAYSTADLSDTHLKVLSIYGTQDTVLNRRKLIENAENLPDDTEVIEIEGGCHSFFGYYGKQKGDGNPSITREEQIKQTVLYMDAFMK